jgi:phosphate transport system permease protein
VKYFFEKLTEKVLLMSSMVTTMAMLLIIIFLFKEGSGLFNKSPIDGNNIILVNEGNPIQNLNANEINKIFTNEIHSWSELTSYPHNITIFTIDDMEELIENPSMNGDDIKLQLQTKIDSSISSNAGLIALLPDDYIDIPSKAKLIKIEEINIENFLFGTQWYPTSAPAVELGALPLILGTLLISLIAILIAVPIGLATAIYMAEVADISTRKILKPSIELLAGIPSVVYGFFGLTVVVPLLKSTFHLPVGETALAGSIILAIMALPTIITVSEDAIRNTPAQMKEASLALGANRWQTIKYVVLPYSSSGITAATILGIGRAVGETMAVLMVTGNAAVIPHSLTEPARTIPATIAAELGEASQGGTHYQALFALGCILFLITLTFNLWMEYVSKQSRTK